MRARDNPYRVERLHGLAFRFQGIDREGLWERFRDLGGRGCVVGPQGSGKTTLLLTLADLLREKGLRVRERGVRADASVLRRETAVWCGGLGDRDVLMIDGADLLGAIRWRRIRQETGRTGGLIVSSHGNRLLPVLYRCEPTPALLEDLIRELHPVNGCGQPSPDQLFARHRGNLREALRELYDFHAGLPDGRLCGLP